MKVLLVGNGAREHAIAWKLLRDDPSIELICASGNAGIAELGECIPVKPDDVAGLLGFAERADVELTVVGPEGPLAAGIVDEFRDRGRAIFGPTRSAARIETSKRFAKKLMLDAGIPTARASHHTDAHDALAAVKQLGMPAVIKASGLAAGKGVVIARSLEEAERAVYMMLEDRAFGAAGEEILVEEFMEGEELSLFVLTDGTGILPMIAAQDHKRLLDGDIGPNTGGMGAYAPVSIATPDLVANVVDRIIEPTLRAMRGAGSPFTGLLYAGLMLTSSGASVVEFNCRFGDPETESILPLMKSSLLDPIQAIANGGSLEGIAPPTWLDAVAVTTVLAAAGYPDVVRRDDPIRLPAPPRGLNVFHAATARDRETGELVTSGGRVLAITGTGATIAEAAASSQEFAERVSFPGKQFRRDIGWRELERNAGAS
ncbi:MAG TPA: phosphoribosylamine--glycine ligase [Gemmatimonadaceae bacterium]|nr:phosphoribosylamine--glycine ligase [Gemmatimonadaceae bacterium]